MQTDGLLQAKQQIHIMHCLSACAFQQVINHRDDQQLVVDTLQMDQALIGVDHLLQVGILIGHERKVMIVVILLVKASYLGDVLVAIQVHRRKDTAREVATHRDEIELMREIALQLLQALVDLGQMLMLERLVD